MPTRWWSYYLPNQTRSSKCNTQILLFIFYRINLTEAVKLLQSFGVTNAINLDGGGSSTFVINSTVVNYPGDEKNGYGSSLSFCLFAGTNPRWS